ncbi:hypothetical protein OAK87_00600 [bacterium]|nr:hypothetical protein [bacterium]
MLLRFRYYRSTTPYLFMSYEMATELETEHTALVNSAYPSCFDLRHSMGCVQQLLTCYAAGRGLKRLENKALTAYLSMEGKTVTTLIDELKIQDPSIDTKALKKTYANRASILRNQGQLERPTGQGSRTDLEVPTRELQAVEVIDVTDISATVERAQKQLDRIRSKGEPVPPSIETYRGLALPAGGTRKERERDKEQLLDLLIASKDRQIQTLEDRVYFLENRASEPSSPEVVTPKISKADELLQQARERREKDKREYMEEHGIDPDAEYADNAKYLSLTLTETDKAMMEFFDHIDEYPLYLAKEFYEGLRDLADKIADRL